MAGNSFDQVLAELKVPVEDLDLPFKEVVEKHKGLREGYLRQSEFSRKMNQVDKDLQNLGKWQDWRTEYWDEEHGMTRGEYQLSQQREQLEGQVKSLTDSLTSGDGMTFDELLPDIDKHLTAQGFVKKADAVARKDIFDDKGAPKFASPEVVNSQLEGFGYLFNQIIPATFKHKDEFNEVLEPGQLLEYANKNGIQDIGKAYESWVAPRRTEAANKKHAEDIEAAKKAGAEEALKNQAMGQEGRMPVDQGGQEMGHMQRRVLAGDKASEGALIPDDVPLGKGIVSARVAEQYMKDKSGQQAA